MDVFELEVRSKLQKISQEQEKIEADKAQNEANNWLETFHIKEDRLKLENERAIFERDHQGLEERKLQFRLQEDQRRRNRFVL